LREAVAKTKLLKSIGDESTQRRIAGSCLQGRVVARPRTADDDGGIPTRRPAADTSAFSRSTPKIRSARWSALRDTHIAAPSGSINACEQKGAAPAAPPLHI